MSDIIRLLPDHVASQIAAGEVIQRPASVVKELMENSVDAGATSIKLYIKEGGRSFITITDNGCGMSATDARMCWERHATSKLQSHDDLYQLHTMGFRGEAMASVASIAQVQLKTRRAADEVGTQIYIEGSKVVSQEPCSMLVGTTVTVKNLFYNVPARRNFLKSNPVETRYIIDEFVRVALSRPEIAFELYNNDQEVYTLEAASCDQRFKQIYPDKDANRLLRAAEDTPLVSLEGWVGAPASARKSRGEQFLYVNRRYFRDPYLNHAIMQAYENLLPPDTFPSYLFYISIDPSRIDVNVHPTKTEIKFEDDKIIYQILRAVVRKAIAQFVPTPEIAFNEQPFKAQMDSGTPVFAPPGPAATRFHQLPYIKPERNPDWKKVIDPFAADNNFSDRFEQSEKELFQAPAAAPSPGTPEGNFTQWLQCFIAWELRGRLYLIDQQAAHARVLFEEMYGRDDHKKMAVQQKLFPKVIELPAPDFALLEELLEALQWTGFDISVFGKNTLIVNGTPADLKNADEKALLNEILDAFKEQRPEHGQEVREKLAKAVSSRAAMKPGTILTLPEMQSLVSRLFECRDTRFAPDGTPIFRELTAPDMLKLLKG